MAEASKRKLREEQSELVVPVDEYEAEWLINYSGGELVSIVFVKRSNGTMRKLTGRKKVTAHLKGGEMKYDAQSKDLIKIFDMGVAAKNEEHDPGYRTIPIEGIVRFRLDGIVYEVNPSLASDLG